MGRVSATIFVRERNLEKGWTYTHWILNLGKGQGPVREDVQIVCAESSQRYMSREEAIEEAKSRVRVKLKREYGSFSEREIQWAVEETK